MQALAPLPRPFSQCQKKRWSGQQNNAEQMQYELKIPENWLTDLML